MRRITSTIAVLVLSLFATGLVFAPVTSAQTELITNGSFTNGASGWTKVGDFWAGTTLSNFRTSPGYAAGGVDSTGNPKNNANGYIRQSVNIPSNATSATLSFYYSISTTEPSGPYDFLYVTIKDSSGNYLQTATPFNTPLNNTNATGGSYSFINYTLSNVTSLRGQTIIVDFLATTDPSYTTIFRIDDVSLMVQQEVVAPPTVTGITINGPSSVAGGSTANYTATAIYSDGTTQNVTSSANWSVSAYASINSSGVLTTQSVTSNQTATIRATFGGWWREQPVTITPTYVPPPPPGRTATTTSLTSSLNPSTQGASVTFTATVSCGFCSYPTGSVTFKDGATTLGMGALSSNGTTTHTTSALSAGPHSITAVYTGDTSHGTSTSLPPLTHTVNPSPGNRPTQTILTTTPNPSIHGESVTVIGTVMGGSGATPPEGNLTLRYGAELIEILPMINGGLTHTYTNVQAPVATYNNITAEYSGDANHASSISPAHTHTVVPNTVTPPGSLRYDYPVTNHTINTLYGERAYYPGTGGTLIFSNSTTATNCGANICNRSHTGIDFGGDEIIHAAATGKVVKIVHDDPSVASDHTNRAYNVDHDMGNTVIIEHRIGNCAPDYTLYSHLSLIDVTLTQHVVGGQRLGLMGNTGHGTGIHLHFEVKSGPVLGNPKVNGSPIDPVNQSRWGYVRPLEGETPTEFGYRDPMNYIGYTYECLSDSNTQEQR